VEAARTNERLRLQIEIWNLGGHRLRLWNRYRSGYRKPFQFMI
jgi:hypothetical protein